MDHHLSKLTNTMVHAAVSPDFGRCSSLLDVDEVTNTSDLKDSLTGEPQIHQPLPTDFNTADDFKKESGNLSIFEMDSSELSEAFYKKLQQLKDEHQKTLHMLELLYMVADARCYEAENDPKIKDIGKGTDVLSRNGSFSSVDVSSLVLGGRDEMTDGGVSQESKLYCGGELNLNIHAHDPTSTDSKCRARVKEIWGDFSLKDHIAPVREEKKKAKIRTKSAPPKKEWSPIITVPKPFQMTIREENKKAESHRRSSEEVVAPPQKQDGEELVLQRTIKARDPPAHTFLPLFEEIMERQKERGRINRQNASLALQKIVQPFTFMERETLKKKHQDRIKCLKAAKEERKLKSMVQFVATPVPSSVYDPNISERMKEEQLYRQIKIKMRSEDLMRESKLPPHMASHEAIYADRKKKKTRDIRRSMKMPFRPQTHNMPDFEALHRRNAMEQSANKFEATIPEPFHLHTSELHKKQVAMQEATLNMQRENSNSKKSRDFSLNRTYVPATDPMPIRMTESARLRLGETRKNLAKAEAELLKLKAKEKEREERKRKMAKEVSSHFEAIADGNLSDSAQYRKERLRHYQEQQRARNQEYLRELKEMGDRLKQRPLLFEQQAQNSARVHAEKHYEEVLRSAGLTDDEFDANSSIEQHEVDTDADFNRVEF